MEEAANMRQGGHRFKRILQEKFFAWVKRAEPAMPSCDNLPALAGFRPRGLS